MESVVELREPRLEDKQDMQLQSEADRAATRATARRLTRYRAGIEEDVAQICTRLTPTKTKYLATEGKMTSKRKLPYQ